METETRAPITLSASVGKEIRKLLIDLDLTQNDLAGRIGENEMWVSRRLRGSIPIDLNDLDRMARALDVDVLDILPRREGKLIAVGATSAPSGPRRKGHSSRLSKRPRPIGPPNRTAPDPAILRPARIPLTLAAA